MSFPEAAITILSDNHAEMPLLSEHGLALWIETGGKRVLLDTGQGAALTHNASLLGVSLAETDVLVLSHGHYDHTGGVPDVLREAPNADVYLHPAAFLPRYSVRGGKPKSVQIQGAAMSSIVSHPEALVHWVSGPVFSAGGCSLTGPIPRITGFEDTGGPFYLDPGGNNPDLIEDDMAVWFDSEDGLVVCTGCCHSGIINTLHYIISLSGQSRIKQVVGGLHLVGAGQERLERTAEALNEMQIEELVPCHCTGDHAVEYLSGNLTCRVRPGYAGLILK